MDTLGNYVDEEGNSLDMDGRVIDCKDYFISDGQITVDKQRENEYSRKLGKKIVEEFHKINRVFSSHLVAFTAFQMIKSPTQNSPRRWLQSVFYLKIFSSPYPSNRLW